MAAGKSTVARIFAENGIPVLDADLVARELGGPSGAAHGPILKRFGTADRARLREIVFADARARKDLEAILHPLIREESLRRMAELAARAGRRHVIYEAALLVETGRYRDFAGLIVVESLAKSRKARLIERDGADDALAERMIASQASEEKRREAATEVITNDGSLDDLRQKVESFIVSHGWR